MLNEDSDAEDEIEQYVEEQEDERVEEMGQRASDKKLKVYLHSFIFISCFPSEKMLDNYCKLSLIDHSFL